MFSSSCAWSRKTHDKIAKHKPQTWSQEMCAGCLFLAQSCPLVCHSSFVLAALQVISLFVLQNPNQTYANADVTSHSTIMMLQIAPSDSPKIHFRSHLFFFYPQCYNYILPLWCSGEAKSGYDRFDKGREAYSIFHNSQN